MIIIAHLVYPFIQHFIGSLLTWIFWYDRNLSCTVQNNLKGHMGRNSKTAFMYMIAITFAIFAGVTFTLQRDLLMSMMKMILGADIVGAMLDVSTPLDELSISNHLDLMKQRKLVEEYTFISNSLRDTLNNEATNYKYSASLSNFASIFFV